MITPTTATGYVMPTAANHPIDPAALRALGLELHDRPDTLRDYGRDWSRLHPSAAAAVVFPRAAEQVVELVRYANRAGLPWCPPGGVLE